MNLAIGGLDDKVLTYQEPEILKLTNNILKDLRVIGINEETQKKYELYYKAIIILEREFYIIGDNNYKLFLHDLNNLFAFSGIIELIKDNNNGDNYFKCIDIDLYKNTIITSIEKGIYDFIIGRVQFLKEEGVINGLYEIGNILGVDFLDLTKTNNIDGFIKRVQNIPELLNFSCTILDLVCYFTIRDKKITLNFTNSLLVYPIKQEFWFIIENLISNSVKAFNSNRVNGELIINCQIKDSGNGSIYFFVEDNGGGIECELLFKRLFEYRGNLDMVKNLIDYIIKCDGDGLDYNLILNSIFFPGISTFGTSGMGLHLCREKLLEKKGNIEVSQNNGKIRFSGTYNGNNNNLKFNN